jgi:hypothetical protein
MISKNPTHSCHAPHHSVVKSAHVVLQYVASTSPHYEPTTITGKILQTAMTNILAAQVRWQGRHEMQKINLRFVYITHHTVVEQSMLKVM